MFLKKLKSQIEKSKKKKKKVLDILIQFLLFWL